MLRPASKTKTASAPAHSSRQARIESPRVGPLPEQGVSLEDGVPTASPARSGFPRIAPALSPARVPRAPPGPPRSRPASRACRFQRAQEQPRRPEWTPKPPARGPRRTLIPTRVPPRELDTRRLQEPPPPPPPLPPLPPPLARRGGEGMWRGRPRSASAPPPIASLRPGTQPHAAGNAAPSLQPGVSRIRRPVLRALC
ncbi:formin-like protein 5 [Grammomys surdaster]|uniref:formin-like protein 5 n=1 Tax=Grammomys surdaster TaxID=491861 RepID=UPI00109FF3BC|nr:formin-like protein 5 [Grammomys surdaster]